MPRTAASPAPSDSPASDAASTPTDDPGSTPTNTHSRLDAAIARLQSGSKTWRALTLDQRARLLQSTRVTVGAAAEAWATTAATIKGLGSAHPLRGEEWLSGPYAVLGALDAYAATLRRLSRGISPLAGTPYTDRPGDRTALLVFPRTRTDTLVLSGFTGELWLKPRVTAADARASAGLAQGEAPKDPGVGLVLGAGNVTSIPPLDALYELLASDRVALVKLNPTMDAVLPVFERAFAPLVELNLVAFVPGDGAVGEYLVHHPGIAHVHITGSATTFDAIVWGPEGQTRDGVTARDRRKATDDPVLTTPITAELGGVSPVIVVPGDWSAADLRFQAESIATMRLTNAGHNCIAAQVVLVSSDWAQRDEFVSELRAAYARAPRRDTWYPHAQERVDSAAAGSPIAETSSDGTRVFLHLRAGDDASALEQTEYFAPVLGVVELRGTGQEFLDRAVAHANDKLTGTLGANVLIDPETENALGDGFLRAITDLRYGSIAINAWTGAAFILPTLSWGAYPGNTSADVGSGIGVVHNACLVSDVERSVLRGPFRPFPRALAGGVFTLLPKPPWFVSSRTGAAVSEGLTRFLIDRRLGGLLATFARAFRA